MAFADQACTLAAVCAAHVPAFAVLLDHQVLPSDKIQRRSSCWSYFAAASSSWHHPWHIDGESAQCW
eukprot:1160435-Pelagomonas_calceolata.AAC.7